MYLFIHSCFTLLLSFVLGISAQTRSVTVDPATVKLGEDALMMCTYTLAPGDALLTMAWFKSNSAGSPLGDSIVSSTVETTNGRYSLYNNGSLGITDVEVVDGGYYLCRIFTTDGGIADGFSTLTVNYLKTPVLEPEETFVKVNETATFTCPLPEGVPTPITITWIKDDSVHIVSDTEKYPQSDTTLEISRVNEMDEGDYQCRAENTAYSGNEGKLSNTGTLTLLTSVTTTIGTPTTDGGDGSDGGDGGSSTGVIVGIVLGCLVVMVILGGIFYSYRAEKYCFSENGNKTSEGTSERVVLNETLSDNEANNTYAEVQKPKKAGNSDKAVAQPGPPKPKRAGSRENKSDQPKANVEQLTYAELDLTKDVNDGNKDKIIRTEPETEYSSVMVNIK